MGDGDGYTIPGFETIGFVDTDVEYYLYFSLESYNAKDAKEICLTLSSNYPGLTRYLPPNHDEAMMAFYTVSEIIMGDFWFPAKRLQTTISPVQIGFGVKPFVWQDNQVIDEQFWMTWIDEATGIQHREPDGTGKCLILTTPWDGSSNERFLADVKCQTTMARVICGEGGKAKNETDEEEAKSTVESGNTNEVQVGGMSTSGPIESSIEAGRESLQVESTAVRGDAESSVMPSGTLVEGTGVVDGSVVGLSTMHVEGILQTTADGVAENSMLYTSKIVPAACVETTEVIEATASLESVTDSTQTTPEVTTTTNTAEESENPETTQDPSNRENIDTKQHTDYLPVVVCPCKCSNLSKSVLFYTNQMTTNLLTSEIKRVLAVDVTNTSYAIRRKSSAGDTRTTARVAGVLGIIFILTSIAVIIALDAMKLFHSPNRLNKLSGSYLS